MRLGRVHAVFGTVHPLCTLQEQRQLEEEAREVEAEVDYLAPYIARLGLGPGLDLGHPETLTTSQALAMRDDCLNDFKRQYVTRAQQMQNRFEMVGLLYIYCVSHQTV